MIQQIQQEHPEAFKDSLLFVFLDPFGPKPLTFETVANILRTPRSEVLLHFDADGADRMVRALAKGFNQQSSATLDRIFGGNSWNRLNVSGDGSQDDFDTSTRALVRIYLDRIRTEAEYAFPFQMVTPKGTYRSEVGYYLIMTSNHPRGLEMKSVMKGVGQGGTYRFSNFLSRQPFLFDPTASKLKDAEALLARFAGQTDVTWRDVMRFTLNDTDLISPKAMLKVLEDRGVIGVRLVGTALARKRSTYPERLIPFLRFDFPEGGPNG